MIHKQQAIKIANTFIKKMDLVQWRLLDVRIPRSSDGMDNFVLVYDVVPGMSMQQVVLEVDQAGNLFNRNERNSVMFNELFNEAAFRQATKKKVSFEF